jgi:hypothetical protein
VSNVAFVSDVIKADSSRNGANHIVELDWGDLFEERAAIRQYDGRCTRVEAERLAWGELETRWHMQRGERVDRDVCAGCRRAIANGVA